MINDNDKPQHTKTEDLLKDVNKRPQKKSQYTTLITNSLDAFLETEDPIHTVRKEVRKAIGITDEYVITKNESKSLQASSIDNNMISSTMEKNNNDYITIDSIAEFEQKVQNDDTTIDSQVVDNTNQTRIVNTTLDLTKEHENAIDTTIETETSDKINIINDTKDQIQITENKIDEIESVLKEIAEITSSSNINEDTINEVDNNKKVTVSEKILNEEITNKKATPHEMANNQNIIENDTFEGTQTVFRKKKKEIIRRKTLTVADTAEFMGESVTIENNAVIEAKNEIINNATESTKNPMQHTSQKQTEVTKDVQVKSAETSQAPQIFIPTQNDTEKKTSWCYCFRWCRK